ncbi:hypothetical protein GUA87_07455 [Sneathiella sp. P13V-1]|uniref:cell division protein FtsL n=1 Tax=Sneathiella sp. P13V-1 TaxID=2697366 RepID=UPI00187BAD1D|nr:hypothetical protein [Sneathiella sp. P13V-1]MBE7636678.1 hypothetical protein [Sneathiella sp. P13V-1]
MKWQLTAASLSLVVGVSYGLYQLSYEVQTLEGELAELNGKIRENEQATEILKAEWAYQNRPENIQALTAKYLPLLLVAPYQVAGLNDLPERTLDSNALAKLTDPVPRQKPRFNWVYEIDGVEVGPSYTLASFGLSSGVEGDDK